MKDFIQPSYSIQACKTKKGLFWVLELLVFVAVMVVASFATGIVSGPAQAIMMFQSEEFLSAVTTGDANAIMEASMALASSDVFMIVSLISEALMILVVLLFCKLIQKRSMSSVGFRKAGMFKEYGIGVVAGFVFFSAVVGLGLLTGALEFGGRTEDFAIWLFLLYLVGYMIQGMAEEVLCRGYLMGSVARRYPVWVGIVANSLFFAALHLLNSGITVLAFINLTLFGVFASMYFIRRGNIWGIGAFHSIWNLVQGNFYGIKVSGNPLGNSFLVMNPVEGKAILSGGDFGLEGSILCTLVYVVGIVILYFMKNKDTEEEVVALANKMEQERANEEKVDSI